MTKKIIQFVRCVEVARRHRQKAVGLVATHIDVLYVKNLTYKTPSSGRFLFIIVFGATIPRNSEFVGITIIHRWQVDNLPHAIQVFTGYLFALHALHDIQDQNNRRESQFEQSL